MPDVSVIVPVYNAARYMRPSLDALLAQTHPSFEVILVDDGSSDESGKICDDYAARDDRVRVIHQANAGAGMARNAGMDAANGDYLYFCDADDETAASLLSDNIRLARMHDADIVVFGFQTTYEAADGTRHLQERYVPPQNGALDYASFWAQFPRERTIPPSLANRLFRRAYLESAGIRHTNRTTGEDTLFLLETYDTPFSAIVYNRAIYYNYLRHPGSATTVFQPQCLDNELFVSHRFDSVVSAHAADGCYRDLIDKKYVTGLCMGAASLARAGKALPLARQARMLRDCARDDRLHDAIRRTPLRALASRGTKVKVLLLKLHAYRLLCFLGAHKARTEF